MSDYKIILKKNWTHLWKISLLSLCFSCSNLLYYPNKLLYEHPSQRGWNTKDYYFLSADGVRLHGWLISTKKKNIANKGLIFQLHGNAENISSHYLSLAWLVDHGFQLFTFDYRSYGTSENIKATPKGMSLDVTAALQQAQNIRQEQKLKKFIVVGQSLGGSLTLYSLTRPENKKLPIDLVILDSTFRSNSAVGASILRKSWLTYLFSPLSYLLLQDNYNASVRDLQEWSYPTLCVTHRDDPVVPSYHLIDIHRQLGSSKKWLWLRSDPYVGHVNSFFDPKGPLNDQLLTFLNQL